MITQVKVIKAEGLEKQERDGRCWLLPTSYSVVVVFYPQLEVPMSRLM